MREKHQRVVTSHMPLTGDLACNLGMCPDWELNWRLFGLQAHAQSTDQPGLQVCVFKGQAKFISLQSDKYY